MEIIFKPIGLFRSEHRYPYDASTQPTRDYSHTACSIELYPGSNFEQALKGLEQMSHVWVIFWFNQNSNWTPMVMPPRGSLHKVGVLATRSPHRPNSIGLSLLRLKKIEGRTLWFEASDILNDSPILDIKPFHPESDTPLDPQMGWMTNLENEKFQIHADHAFKAQSDFLFAHRAGNLLAFAEQQLEYDPLNHKKKRVAKLEDDVWILSYRTWRIHFKINIESRDILLTSIQSGYSQQDLGSAQDIYQDKDLHRKFQSLF
jgi:tRNA-Thr(GGU) m(6)t(6)A37 methyltransferase TsaA